MRLIRIHFALFFIISFPILAEANLDGTVESILDSNRLSRIPEIIQSLEARAHRFMDQGQLLAAKEDLKKALLLKSAIGVKDSEGSASLLLKASHLETKLGNRCEAEHLSHLAKRIYHRLGVQLGAISFHKPTEKCSQLSWMKE